MAQGSVISGAWARATSQSANAKIFRAGIVVSSLGMVTTGATAIKELVIARYFGRNDAIDAFFIAYLLPSFIVTLIVGSLGSALIPVFVEARQHRGEAAAQELFSSVALLNVVALAILAALLGLLAPVYLPYVGSGFSPEKLQMTRELLVALLPFIVFSGTALCITSVLNAGERFALPALVPLFTPVAVITLVILTTKQWGAYGIVAGTVSGSLLEAGTLAAVLNSHGIRFQLKWNGLSEDVCAVLRQYTPMLAGSFLIGSTLVVDKAMAAMLPGGSVAALSYANKIVSAIVTIGAAALSTASFPYFSKMVTEKDWSGCRHTLKRYLLLVMAVSVPLTLCLIAFSRLIVRILFQRGAFTPADTALVSRVQICYLMQIPFYTAGMLFVRFLSAARRNDVLMYGAIVSVVLDVVLNLIFMHYWGVSGIALSTSAVYLFSFLFVVGCSLRLLGKSLAPIGRQSITADRVARSKR
jgi:putative peptidoglycan lipid II flippase